MPLKNQFLAAHWRNLAILNYPLDPGILAPYLPAGTELDFYHGQTFVSMVGFQFLNTQILGLALPFHVNFEEVNLRFYVRHKAADGWRRGVVFIRELVPRTAIAVTARILYNEPYRALPMSHSISVDGSETTTQYNWKFRGRLNSLSVVTTGEPQPIMDDSPEAFITEHYWGYNRQRNGATMEYEVKHERWQFWPALRSSLTCDIAALYGSQFVAALQQAPHSAFLATGAPVTVSQGRRTGEAQA